MYGRDRDVTLLQIGLAFFRAQFTTNLTK